MSEFSFRRPKNPVAPDAEFYGRALYDLAFAMVGVVGGNTDYGEPIRLTRVADNGGVVTTTYHFNDGPTPASSTVKDADTENGG